MTVFPKCCPLFLNEMPGASLAACLLPTPAKRERHLSYKELMLLLNPALSKTMEKGSTRNVLGLENMQESGDTEKVPRNCIKLLTAT